MDENTSANQAEQEISSNQAQAPEANIQVGQIARQKHVPLWVGGLSLVAIVAAIAGTSYFFYQKSSEKKSVVQKTEQGTTTENSLNSAEEEKDELTAEQKAALTAMRAHIKSANLQWDVSGFMKEPSVSVSEFVTTKEPESVNLMTIKAINAMNTASSNAYKELTSDTWFITWATDEGYIEGYLTNDLKPATKPTEALSLVVLE